jgi:hypothetical protein
MGAVIDPVTPGSSGADPMYFAIGAGLALLIGIGATSIGFDRDRSFYPVTLVVIASCYDLFALLAPTTHAFAEELIASLLFIGIAVMGFRTNLWLVFAALAGHGLFDLMHSRLIDDPGVPRWWPAFCMSYDLVAAGYLAWRLGHLDRLVPDRPRRTGQR